MYPYAYQDLEAALANGEAVLQLGQPVDPTLTTSGGEGSPSDSWVTAQGDIEPGDPARPGGQLPPGFGWPAAVAIRPGRWDLETSSYRVAIGDTLAGLAATYLGSPGRLMEIWMIQSAERRARSSADVLYPDEWLRMPPDAEATLRAAVGLPPGESGGTAAEIPAGGYVVSGQAPAGSSVEQAKKAADRKKYLIAGAAVVGGLGLLWALS
jgi:hypothetical protein